MYNILTFIPHEHIYLLHFILNISPFLLNISPTFLLNKSPSSDAYLIPTRIDPTNIK